jgi:phasin
MQMATAPKPQRSAPKILSETAEQAAGQLGQAAMAAESAARDTGEAAFSYPTIEMPEFVRSIAEQTLSQTRDAYARMKTAAEEATDLLESSIETTRDGVREAQLKALDIAKENTEATFELARRLLVTTSVADAMQLQAAFARERFEAFIDYSKEMQAALNKAGTEASKPVKTLFERTLSFPRAA